MAGVGEQAELHPAARSCREPPLGLGQLGRMPAVQVRGQPAASAASCARTLRRARPAGARPPSGQRRRLRRIPRPAGGGPVAASGPPRAGRARSRRMSAGRRGWVRRAAVRLAGDEDRDQGFLQHLPVIGEDPAGGGEQPALAAGIDGRTATRSRGPAVVQAGPHPLQEPRGPAGARASGTPRPAGRGRARLSGRRWPGTGRPGTRGTGSAAARRRW